MDCRDLNNHIDLYVDGELARNERLEVEAHTASCAECAGLLRQRRELKRSLRSLASSTPMSPEFRARLRGAIAAAPAPAASAPPVPHRPRVHTAAAFAAVAVLSVGAPWHLTNGSPQESSGVVAMEAAATPPLVSQAGQWHSRQLPIEVTGPDHDAVRSWFRGKVDFPVVVPDLGRRGMLLGGRLGNVDDQLAAMLIYELDGAKISVMAVDAAPLGTSFGPETRSWESADGFSVAVRSRNGVAYAFTASIPEQDLVSLLNASLSVP